MTNATRNGAQRRTQAAQARPQGSGAPRATTGAMRLLTPEQTEGTILRMAGVLSADLAANPRSREVHTAYITGAIALALTLGELTDARALAVRRACLDLFDGTREPVRTRSGTADPAYAAMVSAVRRHGGASMNAPLAMAELAPGAAARMLARLIAEGVVGQGDVDGYHQVTKGDC